MPDAHIDIGHAYLSVTHTYRSRRPISHAYLSSRLIG